MPPEPNRHELAVSQVPRSHLTGIEPLVVSEALTNATVHAYVGLPLGPVALAATVLNGELRVTVTDEGGGMIPAPTAPDWALASGRWAASPTCLRSPAPGGLGTEGLRQLKHTALSVPGRTGRDRPPVPTTQCCSGGCRASAMRRGLCGALVALGFDARGD